MNTAFHPGKVWLDTKGERIQAHGGSIFYLDNTYYWYGENKEFTDEEKASGIGVCAAMPPKICITGRIKA